MKQFNLRKKVFIGLTSMALLAMPSLGFKTYAAMAPLGNQHNTDRKNRALSRISKEWRDYSFLHNDIYDAIADFERSLENQTNANKKEQLQHLIDKIKNDLQIIDKWLCGVIGPDIWSLSWDEVKRIIPADSSLDEHGRLKFNLPPADFDYDEETTLRVTELLSFDYNDAFATPWRPGHNAYEAVKDKDLDYLLSFSSAINKSMLELIKINNWVQARRVPIGSRMMKSPLGLHDETLRKNILLSRIPRKWSQYSDLLGDLNGAAKDFNDLSKYYPKASNSNKEKVQSLVDQIFAALFNAEKVLSAAVGSSIFELTYSEATEIQNIDFNIDFDDTFGIPWTPGYNVYEAVKDKDLNYFANVSNALDSTINQLTGLNNWVQARRGPIEDYFS